MGCFLYAEGNNGLHGPWLYVKINLQKNKYKITVFAVKLCFTQYHLEIIPCNL